MKNIKNVSIRSNSTQVRVTRDGINRSRQFLHSKFGGQELATNKAAEYAEYLHNCTLEQFVKAYRRPGRPLQTEFFGRRLIKN